MSSAEEPLIYVVEDDAAMRDALQLLLRGAGFSVVCYANAEEFLAKVNCARPYCLLTDVRLPGMDGIALHRHLVSCGAEPTVVMITGHGDVPMAVAALKNGVADFVEKPFDPAVLLDSLREASQRAVAAHHRAVAAADLKSRLLTLTPRETEILALLAEGCPTKAIAAKLGISTRTTEHHRTHIMQKLEARSLSHLIRMMLTIND
jgi:two-component system, LuxR family, response regulator FixJ